MNLLALITASLLAASVSQAAPTEKDNCQMARSLDDSDPSIAKEFWDQSLAGVTTDEWINEHGFKDWVRLMSLWVFKDDSVDSLHCYGIGSNCINPHTCMEYRAHGQTGLYAMYKSIETLKSFLDTLHTNLQDKAIKEILDIDEIVADFKRDESEENPNVLGLFSGMFTMAAGAAVASASISGPAGFLGGLTAFVSSLPQPEAKPDEDFGIRLSNFVGDSFESTRSHIDELLGMFGEDGFDQDSIPAGMQKQSFDNPVVNVFGDGQWLLNHPNSGMGEYMKAAYNDMRRALAWQMMRYARKTFLLITDVPKDSCSSDRDTAEVWDDEKEVCYNLYWVEYNHDVPQLLDVSDEFTQKLFGNDGSYDLDRLKTYRNAYDCWVDNDGKIGEVEGNGDVTDNSLPKCWFGITVVKGAYRKDGVQDWRTPEIDLYEFPGQTEGHIMGVNVEHGELVTYEP